MAKKKNTVDILEDTQEEGTPAIFLRRVDVIIQNGENEEPIIIRANESNDTEPEAQAEAEPETEPVEQVEQAE